MTINWRKPDTVRGVERNSDRAWFSLNHACPASLLDLETAIAFRLSLFFFLNGDLLSVWSQSILCDELRSWIHMLIELVLLR